MFTILFIIPIIVSVLFAITFFLRARKVGYPFWFLGVFYTLFFIVLLAMVLVSESETTYSSSGVVDLFSLLFYVAILAIPPTFYYYVYAIANKFVKEEEKGAIVQHYFLPILLLIINIFSFIYLKKSSSTESYIYIETQNVMNYANFIALLFVFPIANCFYIYKTTTIYLKHKQSIANVFSYSEGVDLQWMRQYIIGYCVFIVSVYLIQGYSEELVIYIPTALFLTAYLLYLGIKGCVQKQVVFETEEPVSESEIEQHKEDRAENIKTAELKEKILKKIEEEPYLNKSLTVYEFSKSLGSNSKYVSAVLNTEFNKNFASFINSYRIEKAKELLSSEISAKYTIEYISEHVGFRSRSSFNKAFKKSVGTTPSTYRKNHLKGS